LIKFVRRLPADNSRNECLIDNSRARRHTHHLSDNSDRIRILEAPLIVLYRFLNVLFIKNVGYYRRCRGLIGAIELD
jgi:hypothetical protein